MGKDDYEVIVCKVLVYFYRKLKGKLSEEDLEYYLYPMTKQLPISQEYLDAVLLDLIDQGFIADVHVSKTWGGDVVGIDIKRARITLKGIEFHRGAKMAYSITKKEYELEKLKKENAELKSQAMRYELGKTATAILKESDIEATQDILDFVVGEDAETTKERITKFVGIINGQIKAAETKRATGRTPKDYGGEGHEPSDFERRIRKYRKD